LVWKREFPNNEGEKNRYLDPLEVGRGRGVSRWAYTTYIDRPTLYLGNYLFKYGVLTHIEPYRTIYDHI
jgi:hypothetical protein